MSLQATLRSALHPSVRHPTRAPGRPGHLPQDPGQIPYTMFDLQRSARELHSAHILEGVYHKGQERIWDGRAVLAELLVKHGGVRLSAERLAPLKRVLSTIFWGELAAWRISAELAAHIEPLEARMAATGQAHDEARHFYVMHDYLRLLGYTPGPLPEKAEALLQGVGRASNLTKKLMGMQLMIEPLALTLFHLLREARVEPVLCDLLSYYEKDEARHVALGVHYLPSFLRSMRPDELIDLWAWQMRMFMIQIDGLAELEDDFAALGFTARQVFRQGQGRQIAASNELAEQLGYHTRIREVFIRVSEARLEYSFPPEGKALGRRVRMRRAARSIVRGGAEVSAVPINA